MTSPLRRVLALPGGRAVAPVSAAVAVGVAALLVAQWALVATVVHAVVTARTPPAALAGLLAGLVAVWGVRSALLGLRDRFAARASSRVRAAARREVAATLLRLGPGRVAGESAGELVDTATEGVAALDALVARFVPAAVSAAVLTPVVAVVALVLDPPSGVLLLATAPLLVVFGWLVGTRAADSAADRWAALARLSALLVDTLRVLPVLVSYGRARSAVRWLTEAGESYRTTTLKVLRVAFLSGFVLEFGAALCVALVAVTVGVRLFEGQVDFWTALLVLLLAPEVFAPLRALAADHHARLEGDPAARRLFALLDEAAPARGTAGLPAGVPDVRLVGVTVRHAGRTVLDAVDLDLPAGSRTALVGSSGAGKSSLLQVLLGFRAPDAGQVLVAGVPLATVAPEVWRGRIGYVAEQPWLLPGSVAANVRLGRPDATDAEVERALARAQLLDVVRRLPRGPDTAVGEDGAWLSGGERLRLALARVLVADAEVVVLDEPTAHLDAGNEAAVLAALAEVARGRTVLTVTHRTGALAGADRVVALSEGRLQPVEAMR